MRLSPSGWSSQSQFPSSHDILASLGNSVKKVSLDTDINDSLDMYRMNLSQEIQTNFPEGSLILYNAIEIYSKKVDLLSKCFMQLYHKLLKYSEDTNPDETSEEQKTEEEASLKHKRKKRKLTLSEEKVDDKALGETQGSPVVSDCVGATVDSDSTNNLDFMPQDIENSKNLEKLSELGALWKQLNEGEKVKVLNKTGELFTLLLEKHLDIESSCKPKESSNDSSNEVDKTFSETCIKQETEIDANETMRNTLMCVKDAYVELEHITVETLKKFCISNVSKLNLKCCENLKSKECNENILDVKKKENDVIARSSLRLKSTQMKFEIKPKDFAVKPAKILCRRKQISEDENGSLPVEKHQNLFKPFSVSLHSFDSFYSENYQSDDLDEGKTQLEHTDASNMQTELQDETDSIDCNELNRLEDYGNPSTPAISEDSGRFSNAAFHSDFEPDISCTERRLVHNDSGVETYHNSENEDDNLSLVDHPLSISDPSSIEYYKNKFRKIIEERKIAEKLAEWKNLLKEKSIRSAQFSNFNIHDYGTNILDKFPVQIPKNEISFKSIVENKPVEEIARYFAATLQLANTSNIEIYEKFPGELNSDNIQLQFIKRKRYYEDVNITGESPTFLPSSCKNFMEHFTESDPNEFLHSTPCISSYKFKSSLSKSNIKPVKRRCIDFSY